ncbi:MAG: transcription antitermination factor NusB [Candidatus Eisenbacteria bacterium]|nr:transcription antitermination factor NusB [Candidatus Eisenbacteria bacterium]
MGKRRRGRELALKILYRLDVTGEGWEEVRDRLEEYEKPETVRLFGMRLIEAVLLHREAIDRILGEAAVNWDVRRMAHIDRNILRVALAEYLVLGETPAPVVIDEAIEIAARYSTDDSGAFVNGILDRIVRALSPGSLAAPAPEKETPRPRPD